MTFLSDPTSNKTPKQIFKDELLNILKLSGPVFLANLCQFGMGIVDTLFLGHLGDVEMAAGALGNTWIWGTSFLSFGLVYGMDTLVSQAYGAGNYKLVGIIFQNALVVLTISCLPIALLWWFTEFFMLLLKQDPQLSQMCALYAKLMLPGLLPMAYYGALQRYLNNQGMVWPALIVGSVAFVLNIIFNYLFIFLFGMGFSGAPIATALSRSILPIMLWGYVWYKGQHKKTWHGWSREGISLARISTFLRFGIFGGLMVLLEVWGFEITNILVGGFQSSIILAAHTIGFNMLLIAWMVPMALSVGVSTRIGHYLGEGLPNQAKNAAKVGSVVTMALLGFNAFFIVLGRHTYGKAYSEDPIVLAVNSAILPITALVSIFDGGQTIMGGILRGVGKPHVGTITNFVGYYLCSLPLQVILGYKMDLKLNGIWIAMCCGIFVVFVGNFIYCSFRIDFNAESKRAQIRSEKTVVEFEKLVDQEDEEGGKVQMHVFGDNNNEDNENEDEENI